MSVLSLSRAVLETEVMVRNWHPESPAAALTLLQSQSGQTGELRDFSSAVNFGFFLETATLTIF